MHTGAAPRYVKQFADVGAQIGDALTRYCAEVRAGQFPDREHSYLMERAELSAFHERLQGAEGPAPAPPAAEVDQPRNAPPTGVPEPPAVPVSGSGD